jgi:fatty acid desaturase
MAPDGPALRPVQAFDTLAGRASSPNVLGSVRMSKRRDAVYATGAAASGERQRLLQLAQRSDRQGLGQLAIHLAALLASGAAVLAAGGTPWLLPAMLLHGILVVFLFAPLHEAVHRTAFRSRWLNDGVAQACGALLLLPPAYFRAFHFTHHRHTQDPARDPELGTPKPASWAGYLWHVSGLPYWRERIATSLRHARGQVAEPFIPPHARPQIVREARLLLGLYALLALTSLLAASDLLLRLWLVPALLGQPFLRLYLLAEHTLCPLVPEMLRNSRTTRSTALVRRLAWNMPYHAEHHAHPALPFHALPAAHELLKARIAVQADGYVAVQRAIVGRFGAEPTLSARPRARR